MQLQISFPKYIVVYEDNLLKWNKEFDNFIEANNYFIKFYKKLGLSPADFQIIYKPYFRGNFIIKGYFTFYISQI